MSEDTDTVPALLVECSKCRAKLWWKRTEPRPACEACEKKEPNS